MVKRMVETDLRQGDFTLLDARIERIEELVSQHVLRADDERKLLLLAARFLEGAGQTRKAYRMVGSLLSAEDILVGEFYCELKRFWIRLALNAGDLQSARREVDRIERSVSETKQGFGVVKESVDYADLSRVTTATWLLSAEVALSENRPAEALQSLSNGLRCMQIGKKTADENTTFELLSALACHMQGDDQGIPALAYLYRIHVVSDDQSVEAAIRARIAAAVGDVDRVVGISEFESRRFRAYGPDRVLIGRFLGQELSLLPAFDLVNRLPAPLDFQPAPVAEAPRQVAVDLASQSVAPMVFLFASHGLEEVATQFDYNLKTGPLVVDWSGCPREAIEGAISEGAISEIARVCQRGIIYFNNGAYVDACFENAGELGVMEPADVIFELFRISMAGIPGACGRHLASGPEAARVPEAINIRPNSLNIDLMRRLDHMRAGGDFGTLDDSDIDAALSTWTEPAPASVNGNGAGVANTSNASDVTVSHVGIAELSVENESSILETLLRVTEAESVSSVYVAVENCLALLKMETAFFDITVNGTGESLLETKSVGDSYEVWGFCKAGGLTVSLSLLKGSVVDCSNVLQLVLNSAAYRLRTMPGQERTQRMEVSGFVAEDIGSQSLLTTLRDYALLDGVNQKLKGILITGERGTGKELLARAIHKWSARGEKTFRPVNFGALNKELAAAALFGAVKGAYTGADKDQRGLIQETEGGTLFLDELDEAGDNVQALLKRVVQFGTFNMVGSPDEKRADVRFIAATNIVGPESPIKRDLRDRFLEVRVPALRERRGDIRPLAVLFASECGKKGYVLPDSVLAFLEKLEWPGNVRQLENVIERACAVAKSAEELTLDLFERAAAEAGATVVVAEIDGVKFRPLEKGETLKARRQKEDELHIRYALQFCNGNKKHAAEFLGMTRQGLIDRMREMNISA